MVGPLLTRTQRFVRLSSISWGYVALLALAAAGGAEAESGGDIPLRVAVIYNIVQFVQWPEEGGTGREFQFCVVEGDDLAAGFAVLDNQPLGNRRIRIRGTAPGRLAGCDAAYLPAAAFAAARPREPAMLTVSSGHGLVDQGAMVNLVMDGKRVGFDIGLGTLRRAGLSMSAKVLRLARYVKED